MPIDPSEGDTGLEMPRPKLRSGDEVMQWEPKESKRVDAKPPGAGKRVLRDRSKRQLLGSHIC